MRLWPESPQLVLCWVCRLVSPHVVGITPGVLSQILLYCPYQMSLVSATSKDVVHGKMEISLPFMKKTCDYAGMGPGGCSQQGPCRLPVGESMVGNRAGVGYMGVPGGAAEMTALLQFLGAMPPLPSGACKDLGHIFQL